jgi:hypothetical protein
MIQVQSATLRQRREASTGCIASTRLLLQQSMPARQKEVQVARRPRRQVALVAVVAAYGKQSVEKVEKQANLV